MNQHSSANDRPLFSSTPAASLPAQRSAQELPQVEKSSLTSCLVSGGEELVITGSNFFPESKVIFLEKGPGKCNVHTAAWPWNNVGETACANYACRKIVFHGCLTDCIREATISKNKFMCGLLDKYILQWQKNKKLSFCKFACMKLHVENVAEVRRRFYWIPPHCAV